MFGEVDYRFAPGLTVTAGLRSYWLKQTIDNIVDGYLNFGSTPSDPQTNHQYGVSPKLSVSYQPTKSSTFYASAAKGFRAGGAQASLPFCSLPSLSAYDITHLKSDTLWTYEAGAKLALSRPAMAVSAAVFRIDWSNFQQLATLPCGSFVSINGEKARILGAEMEVAGNPIPSVGARFSIGYTNTSAEEPGNLRLIGLAEGDALPGIPDWTFSLSLDHSRPISRRLTGFLAADYSYTSHSTALLNAGAGTVAVRPAYQLVNSRIGIRWDRSELAFNLRNLTDEKINFGDVGYNGYAQFGVGGIAGGLIPVVVTHQPLTVTLQLKQSF